MSDSQKPSRSKFLNTFELPPPVTTGHVPEMSRSMSAPPVAFLSSINTVIYKLILKRARLFYFLAH